MVESHSFARGGSCSEDIGRTVIGIGVVDDANHDVGVARIDDRVGQAGEAEGIPALRAVERTGIEFLHMGRVKVLRRADRGEAGETDPDFAVVLLRRGV